MLRILSIDDDISVLNANKAYLEEHGYDVTVAESAAEATKILEQSSFDCILLDVKLNDADGFTFCKKLTAVFSTPIIFLTNLGEEDEVLAGFECGGCDYIVKPYRMSELEARIRVRTGSGGRVIHFPPLTLNLDARSATTAGKIIPLTDSEFDILEFLALHPNQPFSQQEIYEKIWHLPFLKQNSTIQVHIVQLRKKLTTYCPTRSFIQTKWGNGYFFSPT